MAHIIFNVCVKLSDMKQKSQDGSLSHPTHCTDTSATAAASHCHCTSIKILTGGGRQCECRMIIQQSRRREDIHHDRAHTCAVHGIACQVPRLIIFQSTVSEQTPRWMVRRQELDFQGLTCRQQSFLLQAVGAVMRHQGRHDRL